MSIDKQVQDSINDPRKSVSDTTARTHFAKRKAALAVAKSREHFITEWYWYLTLIFVAVLCVDSMILHTTYIAFAGPFVYVIALCLMLVYALWRK